MSKLSTPVLRVNYDGFFEFEGLYELMRSWYNQKRISFEEDEYKHKVKGPLGAEIELRWKGYRKESELYRIWMHNYFHFWDVTEEELIKDGKKVKMNRGRFFIDFWSVLEIDYYGTHFTKTPFRAMLGKFYERFAFGNRTGMLLDSMYYMTVQFHNEVKQFLKLETAFNPYPSDR